MGCNFLAIVILSATLSLARADLAGAAALIAPGGGTVRALVIGVDTYRNLRRAAWLRGAVADARDISRALKEVGVSATVLVERDAVRPRVIAEMNNLIASSKAGDLVFITFAGHGMRVREYPRWAGLDASGASSQIVLSSYGRSGDMHDIIVDKEMRAWLARLDTKGVDVLVVIDACFGGNMRQVDPLSWRNSIRWLQAGDEDANHDAFAGIEMTQREARADVNSMSHVTFMAGADLKTVVPEMTGIDSREPTRPRGALSYFVARAIAGEGIASQGGRVTREALLRFTLQNVKQVTNDRQVVSLDPVSDDPTVTKKVVFEFGWDPMSKPEPAPAVEPSTLQGDPVRVAVANGPEAAPIQRGRAPFVRADVADADLVWDVGAGMALSRGDLVMSQVDGSLLGEIIDRTWAIREVQKLSRHRVLSVRLRENILVYTPDTSLDDAPRLIVDGVAESYLTVMNIAADGTIQLLFPVGGEDPYIRSDRWTNNPTVGEPFGADHVIVVATAHPAIELLSWMIAHNHKHDAAELPSVLANTLTSNGATRVGTVGLYTAASLSSAGK
jgi:Caspase domain